MGLLDDEYRGAPEWQRQPANGPWIGLLGRTPPPTPPDLPPDGRYPDAYAYPMPIPPGADDDRAYHPTLQWEDSIPGQREAELMRLRRKAIYDNEPFQQPKKAEDIGLEPMTRGDKLRLLLNQYLGGNF